MAGKFGTIAKGAKAAVGFAVTHREEIKRAAEVAAEYAPQVLPVAQAAAGKASQAVRNAGNNVTSAAQGALEARSLSKEDKEALKVRREALRGVLAAASIKVSAADFLASWEGMAAVDPSGMAHYLETPGCYVILCCKHTVKDDDYSNYTGVYVGSSVNMGRNIRLHLVGLGNPDVYADVKYGQNVYVLAFTQSEGVDELEKNLKDILGAYDSYNKPKV